MRLTGRSQESTLPRIKYVIFSTLQGFFLILSSLYAGAIYWTVILNSSFSYDFNSYYLAGRAALVGRVASVYDVAILYTLTSGVNLGPDGVIDPYIYPPPFLFIAIPFALLPYPLARTLWLLFNLACLSLSLLLLIRTLPIRIAWRTGAGYWLGLVLISFPVYDTLGMGQANCLILMCMTVCYLSARTGKQFWSGVALSSAVAFKFTAAPLLIYFLARKQWNAVLGCIAGLLTWFGAATILFGPAVQLNFVQAIRTWNVRYLGMPDNVSPAALLSRMFAFLSNRDPLAVDDTTFLHIASAASWFYPALFLGTLLLAVIVFFLCLRPGNPDLVFAFAMTGTLLISNLTWFHHLILLLLPALILLSLYQQQPALLRSYGWWLLIVFIALNIRPGYVMDRDASTPLLVVSAGNFLLIAFFIFLAFLLARNNTAEPVASGNGGHSRQHT